MRFISVIAIFIMFSTLLEASYMRSIRVGSFINEDAADQSLYDLKVFVNSSYRLKDLRNEFNFEVKTVRSGRYYISVIEPVTDRRAVQEILDIVRTVYPNAYPKKIKSSSYAQPVKYQQVENDEPTVNHLELIENIDTMLEEEVVVDSVVEQRHFEHIPEKIIEEEIEEEVEVEKSEVIEEPTSHKRFELKRMATLEVEKEEVATGGFSILGYEITMIDFSKIELSDFSFDFFGSEEVNSQEKKIQDSMDGQLSIFEDYKLEILVVVAFFFLIILLKLIAIYRHNKEDQISIQDIYN